MSTKEVTANSLIRALKIIADFVEAIGKAEQEGLEVSKVFQTPPTPDQANVWRDVFSKMVKKVTKEEFLEAMVSLYELGRITNIFNLTTEEKFVTTKSLRRLAELINKVIENDF